MNRLHEGPLDRTWLGYNDLDYAVRASVPAWINQLAMKLLASEPPILINGVSTRLLCREYFAPPNRDQDTWQSLLSRGWLVAGQPRSNMRETQDVEYWLRSDITKTREES